MALVEEHRSTYGLNRCLKALDLSKGTWHYRRHDNNSQRRRTKDEALKGHIVKVIEEHPAYGYRRIQSGSWSSISENRLTTRDYAEC